MTARIFTWDCNQQPDMENIASFVAEISGGKVIMAEVDTQSDEYAWVVADHQVSDREGQRMYEVKTGA
jgi:hypothetical protein